MASVSIVIFGASGDLTSRKLVPALYHLFGKDRLPADTQIVGVARSALSDDAFRERMEAALRSLDPASWQPDRWREFARHVFYVPADGSQLEDVQRLRAWLEAREKTNHGNGARRLYYLAVAPHLYPEIVSCLGEAGMSDEETGWRRLIVEKPFGQDLKSAQALNKVLHAQFREDQIYRIDHYLGKETVQNLLVFRFANAIFEPLWNHQYIDHVQMTVAETVPVGHRAAFYDQTGVLRDMFQSHLLQLLALVAMEAPSRFEATAVRNEKLKVLDAIPVYGPEEAAERVVTGRYRGYLTEPGVNAQSRTPTFAVIRLDVNNWRWQGVPFYLRSGKSMDRRYSEVLIQFRSVPHLMFPAPRHEFAACNKLGICIQPDEGIHLSFQSKVPDEGMALRTADLEFHFRNIYADQAIPEAYERLLQDALHGDATLFMRSDEIERAWQIMDPIIAAVENGLTPAPEEYEVGSGGPPSSEAFLEKDGRQWLSLCRHKTVASQG